MIQMSAFGAAALVALLLTSPGKGGEATPVRPPVCEVLYLDVPFNWQQAYDGRGQSQPQPLDGAKYCSYFASEEYDDQNPGACCSAKFVNEIVAPALDKSMFSSLTLKRCKDAFERLACGIGCARNQNDYMTLLWNNADITRSKAKISICKETCHTLYEDCKDDPGFAYDGTHILDEDQICKAIEALETIGADREERGTNIEVETYEDEENSDRPRCFLYDDLSPTGIRFRPIPGKFIENHDFVPPQSDAIVVRATFNERIRVAHGGGLVKLQRKQGDGAARTWIHNATEENVAQIVTVTEPLDTVEIHFALKGEDHLCSMHGLFEVTIDLGTFEDLAGNRNIAIDSGDWTFEVSLQIKCVVDHSSHSCGRCHFRGCSICARADASSRRSSTPVSTQ